MRLDSDGISRIKSELPINKNPFDYYDKTIVSIDTLKNNAKFQHYIEKTRWDIVVIDECHTVANSSSQRGGLAQLLSTKCESLILTSATPHNGKPENFANLINMIEPLAIKEEYNYSREDIKDYYVRRFKNDIDDDAVRSNFQDREVVSIHAQLSDAENEFLQIQQNIKFAALQNLMPDDISTDLFGKQTSNKQKKDLLFAIGLFKSYMSSPEAALKSIENRISKLDALTEQEDIVEQNRDVLYNLKAKLEAIIHHKQDAKYLAFRKKLIDLGWYGRKRDFRIVVFAERIETLKALKTKLQSDFDLDDSVIADFHGSLTDMEQQRIIDDFGKEDSDYRILLTSDAGSQGVNLHYYCNHMFNYDIPWSLITLEQRNGRIDRYGQTKTPFIHYMVATSDLDGLKDDLHIVNKLKEKEEAVYQSLGDAASVYKLYEASAEEELVTTAIATGNRDMLDGAPTSEESDDWFDALFDESTPRLAIEDPIVEEVSLFENDKSYYTALLEQLKSENSLKTDDACFEGDLLEVKNTPELDRILYDLPKEAKPGGIGDVYQLSLNREDVQKAISDARKRKGEWARFQMLYELHPVVRYLMTQLEASVDKDVALVSKINRLPKDMAYYLIQGLVANNLGQSILSDLFVVPMHRSGGLADRPMKFADFLKEHQINKELYTVEITDEEIKQLEVLLPDAIKFAHQLHMDQQQQKLQLEMEKEMAVYEEKMRNWKRSKEHQMEIKFGDKPEYGFVKRRRRDKEIEIETILNRSSQYFKDLTSLNSVPYLKVLAVFYN
ncbi:Superfamily II DNA or RNA helicase [Proteiniphilum saccharofermentans]|uniref:Superfamily II DNA or RNA helicase n=1 Tax=Proteiniphilum saccharofermentans TaxID=1642647 RepID=A0A1R3T4W4_9BACT|nr:helicase-related protein [Proteiniphilum saccharofermentans]SCD22270.1 Superfamily II DNA or RNA helicase [Proteiniphilum saccharofermentans]SEA51128.1 SNF2 family N-terminal domain-containing protein [Porphyromonadaceae bacterium KH3R12]SFT08208.1 SNF2 family N-terminal domain-containing protein [Porphyromonadaceae bacterium NLAE-zl-C104]